ncbi:hypothetical protein BG011_005272 [Mortierella polycephala]|uniref:SGNH hydrolase-type esterase domain-containing protein n=1 Tax=Mortierella polycephala TaxID=41804 RepID=A0A9P6PYB5_9FUNG|nr:hypothetical protein BG011_005272 [Mortierella polycephala]
MGISLPHSHSHSHHLHHLRQNYNPQQHTAEPGMYSFDVNERGFGAQLAHLFLRRLDVINRGFSGYTTEQAIHLLPQFLPRSQQDSTSSSSQPKIQFLTIFFGANDACLLPSPQHVDLERYEQNLRTLIDTVHSPTSPTYSPETRIIVICPPTIDEDRWAIRRKGQGLMMDRDKDVTKQYAETCLRVAKEYEGKNDQRQSPQHSQVDVIDTWGLMTEQIESGKRTLGDYLRDGLHLASEGNNLIFEQIMKVIRSRFPEWDPDTMPMNAPWWGDLDRKHPETDLLICGNKVKAEGFPHAN